MRLARFSRRLLLSTGLAAATILAALAVWYWMAQPRSMKERLARIAQTEDAEINPFLNRERVLLRRAQLAQETDEYKKLALQRDLATELLNAGATEQALREIAAIRYPGQKSDSGVLDPKLSILQAVAYLRLGEQQNCLLNHNAESCLFPIRGGGIHKMQRGSRQAIKALTALLQRLSNGPPQHWQYPNDLSARWLLNIAYMTVGEYPQKVPARWLIPPHAFRSDYDIKRFANVAGEVGLDVNGLAGGSILEDFDNDGYLDVMCSSVGLRDQLQYFHNNGNGTFSERTKEAGLIGEIGGLNLNYTDYNNDGYTDVLVLRGGWFGQGGHHPNSLLRNNGNGTFTDVTERAGLLSFYPTQTATWFDYNGDGWIDLFIGNESTEGDANPCELYRNNSDGTFTECAAQNGIAHVAFVKGVTSGDYDNDGRPDLYLSCNGQYNVLYHNEGPDPTDKSPRPRWKFKNMAGTAGVTEPGDSFPTFFFDYDNDGWLDIFISGYGAEDVAEIAADYVGQSRRGPRPKLYRNKRDGTFADVTRAARLDRVLLAMGCSYGDLDNDGFLDFYLGTGNPELSMLIPNRMFRNAGGKFFQDVTTSGGFGHLQKGHGISFADIDNDGDQDIYEDMGGAFTGDTAYNALYENPGHGHHWLKLKLEGVHTNRAAFGARIKVIVRTATGRREIYRTVSTGASFGNLPLRQEIGLGTARGIEKVEIFWPLTGKTQSLKGLSLNRFYKIREGDAKAIEVSLKSFQLRQSQPHSHHHHHTAGMSGMPGMTD